MDSRGFEPLRTACKAIMLPLHQPPVFFKSSEGRTRTCDQDINSVPLLPTELPRNKVSTVGIEPTSLVLQTSTITRLVPSRHKLRQKDLNLRSSAYQTDAFTKLSYASVRDSGYDPLRIDWKSTMLPITSVPHTTFVQLLFLFCGN